MDAELRPSYLWQNTDKGCLGGELGNTFGPKSQKGTQDW